jgi:hypothetical protein
MLLIAFSLCILSSCVDLVFYSTASRLSTRHNGTNTHGDLSRWPNYSTVQFIGTTISLRLCLCLCLCFKVYVGAATVQLDALDNTGWDETGVTTSEVSRWKIADIQHSPRIPAKLIRFPN